MNRLLLVLCFISQLYSIKEAYGSIKNRFTKSIVKSFLPLLGIILQSQNAVASDDAWSDRNRLAAEVWRTVDESFYDRTFGGADWFALRQSVVKRTYNTDEELYTSLQKMVQQIGDKYTRYLPPNQYNTVMNSALGELCGVGVELELTTAGVKIISLQPDSPASSSGLKVGDIIVNVDGTDASSLSPEEVAALLRGKDNTKASIRVKRISGGKVATTSTGDKSISVIDFTVVRRPLKIQGVTSQTALINGKRTGILRVRTFSSTTAADVALALASLSRDDPESLVLDMRNNAGGLLEGAVQTAGLFLPPGKIVVFSVGKDGLPRALQTLSTALIVSSGSDQGDDSSTGLRAPLYVLVNENTASAAEVLAAALKENGRGKLIGHQTFGKGLIQTLEPVNGGQWGGVAVTTAKYETPQHHNINGVGLPVDQEVLCDSGVTADTCLENVF